MNRASHLFRVFMLGLTCCLAPQLSAAAPATLLITQLKPTAILHLGATADWVAVTADAIWVGSTGPDAVHRIDPNTRKVVATIELPGEPCAGLAIGFGSVWVPLCAKTPVLAKVDIAHNTVSAVFPTGPAGPEGGVTTSRDSVWLVTDKRGSLARIDPDTGSVRQTVALPAGSYNPRHESGVVWVTRAAGNEITAVDAASGKILGKTSTGPHPRFLTSGDGAVWTLNQGDGSVTRIASSSRHSGKRIRLNIPGAGGDIALGGGLVWTSMPKVPLSAIDAATSRLLCQWVGPGGDSLGIGTDAIWLTSYHAGTVSRLDLPDTVARCRAAVAAAAPTAH